MQYWQLSRRSIRMVSHLVNLTDEPTLCSPLQRVHLLLPQLQRPGGQRHPHDGAALLLPPGRRVPHGPRGHDDILGGEGRKARLPEGKI